MACTTFDIYIYLCLPVSIRVYISKHTYTHITYDWRFASFSGDALGCNSKMACSTFDIYIYLCLPVLRVLQLVLLRPLLPVSFRVYMDISCEAMYGCVHFTPTVKQTVAWATPLVLPIGPLIFFEYICIFYHNTSFIDAYLFREALGRARHQYQDWPRARRDVKHSDSNIRVFPIRLEGLCPRCECTYKILLATGPSLYCKAIHGCTRFTRCQAFGDIDM